MKSSQLYFGRNVLKEALAARASITSVYVETRSAYAFVQSLPGLEKLEVKIEEGIPKQLQNEVHQGVAFRANFQFYLEYTPDLLKNFSFILLCNHIEDVHNLGSIARCAAAFGARLIIHEEVKSASVTPSMVKSSAGCAFKLKFMAVPDLGTLIQPLKKRGYSIVGLDIAKDATALYDWQSTLPMALVLGSEGLGIEESLKQKCDSFVRIPMEHQMDSLNVSHAAGLAMSWVRHHRILKKSESASSPVVSQE